MADWAAAAAAWAQSGEGEKESFVPPPPPPQTRHQFDAWGGGGGGNGELHHAALHGQEHHHQMHWIDPTAHQHHGQHAFGLAAGASDPMDMGHHGHVGGAPFGNGGAVIEETPLRVHMAVS